MLIITTNALASGRDAEMALPWAGPKILVVLPGAGLAQQRIRHLEEDFVTLEFLRPPGGTAALMATLGRCLPAQLCEADWPLLYLDRPFTAQEVEEHLEAMCADQHNIAWDLADDGRLTMLRAGEMVATSPLFPEFLRLASGRVVEDALFAELLRDTFVWSPE